MKNDLLIVAALKEESRGRFETLKQPVIYTGVGKLNAAITLNSILRPVGKINRPKIVINLGTAVSGRYKRGEIVNVTRFIQRDMLCQPLVPKYFTPFDSKPFYIELKKYTEDFENVSCGTGDSFMSSCPIGGEYDVADMEGYALAKVCKIFEIPFVSLKYISDAGNANDWKESLEKASISLTAAAQDLIRKLKKNTFLTTSI